MANLKDLIVNGSARILGTIYGNLTGNVTGNVSGSSGSCTGNAATATKATQDASGNVITTTYATKSQIPTVNNATLTIQKNGTSVATFTANSASNTTANITVPTKVSELTNDSGFTANVGTITGIKMNGASKGTSGVVDLGTVITDISGKQDKLTSGTNIKTINNNSILGSGNLTLDGLPSQSGNTGKYLTTDGTSASWTEINISSYHPPILSSMWSDHLINDIQWLRADTFSWQSGDVYKTVYDKLVEEYATGSEETEGSITFKRSTNGFKIAVADQESAIVSKYNTDGIAWYYILDTTNKRFKLPRTKFGFEGLRTNVGDDIAESLPNIKGNFDPAIIVDHGEYVSGAFIATYDRPTTNHGIASIAGQGGWGFDFDASRSSSTYQDGAPVQERATQMYLYFYVGEYAQTAIEQTAGITSEQLNNKVDTSSLSQIYPVIKTYVSGTSGYRIWSDGYCEQWGFTGAMGDYATATITFVKTFANTNYIIQGNTIWQGTDDDTTWMQAWKIQQNSLKTTGFSFYNRSDTKKVFRWKVCGYLAAGQY